jgi:lipoprotein-releasing system ATP-binding protein
MTDAIIETEHLTRRLVGEVTTTLVNDANLVIKRGEFVAITGASGSGKSSLLYLLGLLDRPTSGTVRLRGEDTALLGDDALAALRLAEIGFVFQFHFLLPEFSVVENVMLPM